VGGPGPHRISTNSQYDGGRPRRGAMAADDSLRSSPLALALAVALALAGRTAILSSIIQPGGRAKKRPQPSPQQTLSTTVLTHVESAGCTRLIKPTARLLAGHAH